VLAVLIGPGVGRRTGAQICDGFGEVLSCHRPYSPNRSAEVLLLFLPGARPGSPGARRCRAPNNIQPSRRKRDRVAPRARIAASYSAQRGLLLTVPYSLYEDGGKGKPGVYWGPRRSPGRRLRHCRAVGSPRWLCGAAIAQEASRAADRGVSTL
jgi:hypothetical protein